MLFGFKVLESSENGSKNLFLRLCTEVYQTIVSSWVFDTTVIKKNSYKNLKNFF